MATKSELIDKVTKLSRRVAELEQARRDNVALAGQLARAKDQIEMLRSKTKLRNQSNSDAEIARLNSEIDRLKRERLAK